MTAKKDNRATWKAALEKVAAEVAHEFPSDGRTGQLQAAVKTAEMAIDNLHDYPQYVLPTT